VAVTGFNRCGDLLAQYAHLVDLGSAYERMANARGGQLGFVHRKRTSLFRNVPVLRLLLLLLLLLLPLLHTFSGLLLITGVADLA
jgi:hypothetical protein